MSKKLTNPPLVSVPYRSSRTLALRVGGDGGPSSLDEASRSVEVIASTEAPAMVMDWERWEVVSEVLLMSGVNLPSSGQVPFLDTHSRDSVSRVLGSFRGGRATSTEMGLALIGRCHFSAVKEADDAYTKVKEGHVTDVSVGYEVLAHIWLNAGETTTVEGKTYTGPLRIGLEWKLAEVSLCPIGADSSAKFRDQSHYSPARAAGLKKEKEKVMPKSKVAGGKKNAAKHESRGGLIARLRRLLGVREEQPSDEEIQDVELVDEDGEPVVPAELTEEELIIVVEGLEEILAEAEEELVDEQEAAADEEKLIEEQRKASRKVGGRRSCSPAQIAKIERARGLAIRALARSHNLPSEMEARLINNGVSLENAKSQVLDMVSQRGNSGPGFQVSVGRTDQEKFRAAVQDALSLRCGHSIEKPTPGSEELRGYSLRELAREMLVRSGQRPRGHVVETVGRALATTDLPKLLVETSRRTLMEAFDAAEETWRIWANTGIASDFKKSSAVGLEGDVKPLLKHEGGEYEGGRLAENAEEYTVRTFGRKMVITREAIINDDLNALTALPQMYGEQTAELVGDVAYRALLSMPNLMGDRRPLFGAAHHNLYVGQGGVPTVDNLGIVVTGMKLQKDSFGKTVTALPKFYLAPVSLEVASEQLFNSQLEGPIIGTQAEPLKHNPYGGAYFTRVYDRRLDASSPTSYYLAAARGTVTVFFLGGVESPYIEEQINFDTDGVESKVRMDVGAKAMRWVTLAKATV